MTRLNGIAACLGALVLTTFLALPAHANLQVRVTDAAGSQVFTNGTDALTANAADGDFTFSLYIATSNSPGGALAQLHIDSIMQATAAGVSSTCAACGAGFNLKIEVSDTAFTQPTGAGTLTQAVNTNTNPVAAATGNSTYNGYLVDGGAIFATGSNRVGPASFAGYAVSNNTTQSAGFFTATLPKYALTEVLQFNLTNTNQGQATDNLSFGAVPEPASIVLLGTTLLGLTALLRKKTQTKS